MKTFSISWSLSHQLLKTWFSPDYIKKWKNCTSARKNSIRHAKKSQTRTLLRAWTTVVSISEKMIRNSTPFKGGKSKSNSEKLKSPQTLKSSKIRSMTDRPFNIPVHTSWTLSTISRSSSCLRTRKLTCQFMTKKLSHFIRHFLTIKFFSSCRSKTNRFSMTS